MLVYSIDFPSYLQFPLIHPVVSPFLLAPWDQVASRDQEYKEAIGSPTSGSAGSTVLQLQASVQARDTLYILVHLYEYMVHIVLYRPN